MNLLLVFITFYSAKTTETNTKITSATASTTATATNNATAAATATTIATATQTTTPRDTANTPLVSIGYERSKKREKLSPQEVSEVADLHPDKVKACERLATARQCK